MFYDIIFFPLENQHGMKSEKHRHEKKNLQPFVVIYALYGTPSNLDLAHLNNVKRQENSTWSI